TKAKLLFVGDGEKRAAVQNRAAALGLTPYVLFLGVREDVPALLHAMDVFCMPSLYEGMPLAVLEAQAAGLPCLVSNGVPKDCLQT
ncbi:MAG TPA: glycosyltransferase family 1 protein, partial [Ruminococcaceae bacterium]|nr:glycosyltransferase family 1 protein [Oscillospiraceae bacterium]